MRIYLVTSPYEKDPSAFKIMMKLGKAEMLINFYSILERCSPNRGPETIKFLPRRGGRK